MTITQFYQEYYFHDSIFLKSEFDSQTKMLTLYCKFCNFLQKNYQDSEPENSDILLIFQNAEFSCNVSEGEVLTQKLIDEHTIWFFLANENHSDFLELSISADSVEVYHVPRGTFKEYETS